jgi:hypothetical protein
VVEVFCAAISRSCCTIGALEHTIAVDSSYAGAPLLYPGSKLLLHDVLAIKMRLDDPAILVPRGDVQ